LVLQDGRIAVALRDQSKVALIELVESKRGYALEGRCALPTAADPVALAQSPDGARLLVASAWAQRLSIHQTDGEMKLERSVALAREPRAVTVSNDGKTAVVAHSVGGHASIVTMADGRATTIALSGMHERELNELRQQLATTAGLSPTSRTAKVRELLAAFDEDHKRDELASDRRTSCQGFALAKSIDPNGPLGDRIFAPQVLVDPGSRERRTVGYGDEHVVTEMPNVAVIDTAVGRPLYTSLRDGSMRSNDNTEHCILPRAAAVDAKNNTLLVTCLGIDALVAYDALSPHPVQAETRRWRVAAGPSGVAVDTAGRRAVVWSQFDRTLNFIPLDAPLEQAQGADDRAVLRIELPADAGRELSVAAALGRALFHATSDTRIARDGRACASCHPDGRDDGLVWATPDGPRRTIMLAGRLGGTAPFAWNGENAELRDQVHDTFERLGGIGGLRSVELRALVAYIESLPAPPKSIGADAALVARGAELFASKEAGCAECHSGADYTDNLRHDVKSRSRVDRDERFNTPSLRFVGGRAPYYHDGRFATLKDLLHGADGSMGHTAQLSPPDMEALEAFLMTL
jgi:mono/diheme cytochrome c family protein